MKDRLAVISTKNPTTILLNTISNIKLFYDEFDIVIIDSDSSDLQIFDLIPDDCVVDKCKNKNYELGAWVYAFEKYNYYKVYMFIQDTLTPNSRIPNFDKNIYETGVIYSYHYTAKLCDGGYFENLINLYKDSELKFISELNPDMLITGGAHNSFILDKENVPTILQLEKIYTQKNIIKTKIDSWLSERTVGIIADTFTKRINMMPFFTKISSGRT